MEADWTTTLANLTVPAVSAMVMGIVSVLAWVVGERWTPLAQRISIFVLSIGLCEVMAATTGPNGLSPWEQYGYAVLNGFAVVAVTMVVKDGEARNIARAALDKARYGYFRS